MRILTIPLTLLFTFFTLQPSLCAQETNGENSRSGQEREIRTNCIQEAEVLIEEEAVDYVKECVELAKTNLNWSEEIPQQPDQITDQASPQEEGPE